MFRINKHQSLFGQAKFISHLGKKGVAVTLVAGLIIASTFPMRAANLVLNGDLSSWGSVSGTPPTGKPTNWGFGTNTSAIPIQAPALDSGSSYSAFLSPATNSAFLAHLSGATGPNLTISFNVAALDPGDTTHRSFYMLLTETNSGPQFLRLRMIRDGASAGLLKLQAFDGAAYQTLVTGLTASTFDAPTDTWTSVAAYTFQLSMDLSAATPSYNLTYGLVGGSMTTLSNLTYWAVTPSTDPTKQGLSLTTGISFLPDAAAGVTAGFAVDSVSVVPEPETVALVVAGCFMVFCRLKRRRSGLI